MNYKDYSIDLEFLFLTCIINFKIQDIACSLLYQHVTIHYYVFLKIIPNQLSYCIIHKLFSIHFIINYLLLPKFIQAFYTYRTISLYLIVVSLMTFLTSSIDIKFKFQQGIFNSFAPCNNFDNVLIYFFVILN